MSFEPVICVVVPKYWPEESTGGENGENRDEDGHADNAKVETNRAVAVCSRLARNRQQWRTLVHEVVTYPQHSAMKQHH